MKRFSRALRIAALGAVLALCLTGQTKKHDDTLRDEASVVDFVTCGSSKLCSEWNEQVSNTQ
jgi:hypothetical protein